MFCKKCGQEIKDGDKFCPNCGTEVNPSNTNSNSAFSDDINNVVDNLKNVKNATDSSSKSRAVALILSCPLVLGLGFLGLHCFYVGKTGRGIAYLLCTLLLWWLLIPLIVVFILSLFVFL